MILKAEYLIGKENEKEWAGVYGYRPENDASTEEMFVVIRIQTDAPDIALEKIAKMLLDQLQNSYFEPETKFEDNITKLEGAVWDMKSKMEFMISNSPELNESGVDIELAIIIIDAEVMYAGIVGESKIFLRRGAKFVDVTKALVDANMMGFLKTGSLKLEEQDRVSLTTSKAAYGSEGLIDMALDKLSINKLDDIKAKSGVAALILADENLEWNPIEEVVETPIPVESETNIKDILESEEGEHAPVSQPLEGFEDGHQEKVTKLDKMSNMPTEVEDEDDEEIEDEGPSFMDKIKDKLTLVKGKSQVAFKNLSGKITEFKNKRSANTGDDEETDEDEFEIAQPTRFSKMQDADQEEDDYVVVEGSFKNKATNTLKNLRDNSNNVLKQRILPALKNNKGAAKVVRNIWEKLRILGQNLYVIFQREIVGSGDRRDKYLRGKRMKRNRILFAVVLVVLVVLIYSGIRNAELNRQKQERIEAAQTDVNNIKNRLESLSSQVLQAKTDNEQKKSLVLTELRNLSDEIDTKKRALERNEDEEMETFINELETLKTSLLSEEDELLLAESFTEPNILTDIGGSYADATLSDMVNVSGALFISDSGRGAVYRVATSDLNVQPQIYVTGLVQPYILVKNVANEVIFYDNDATSSVGKFKTNQEQSVTRFQGLSASNVGKPAESTLYDGNDSLYEVRNTTKQIFKRDKSGDSYVNGGAVATTDATNWKTDQEFASAVDIAAPYEIYMLIRGQGVKRYFAKGDNTITFETYNNLIRSDFEAMKQGSSIDVTTNYMAVGDPAGKRVLLFKIETGDDKKLTFQKQFIYRGDENVFNDIDEIVIIEEQSSIFVLDGNKVIKLSF